MPSSSPPHHGSPLPTTCPQGAVDHVAVLVKDVPAGPELPGLHDDFTLMRSEQDSTMSGVDLFAVTAARDVGRHVTAVTMGPPAAVGTLREALSLGADAAVHICDRRLRGVSAVPTAHVLERALRPLEVDAVFLGRESSDGRTGVVGGMLAELLGWPLISGADELEHHGGSFTARIRENDTATYVRTPLPAVVTVAEYGADPNPLDAASLRRAFLTPVRTIDLDSLGTNLPLSTQQQISRVEERHRPREKRLVTDHEEAISLLRQEIRRVKVGSA